MSTTDRRDFLRQTAGAAMGLALTPSLEHAMLRPRLSAEVRVGVIGCGRQGRAILTELAKIDDVVVAAVADPVESRLSAGGRRARGANSYTGHAALLEGESNLDAVLVATPSHTHREVAEAALSAGVHVYCESPMATTLEDGQALLAAARASDKVFQVGMQGRSNPVYQLARSFWRAGAVRDAVSLRGQYHKKTSWVATARNPADSEALNWRLNKDVSLGLLGEVGVQQFDVFHWFTGRYPVSVRGLGSIRLHRDGREVHDTVHCELTFDDGLTLEYGATLANSLEQSYELLHGTMGAIKLAWSHGWMFKEADAPTQGWEVYANRQQFHNEQGITLIADATQLAAQDKLKEGVGLPHPALYYPLVDFLKSITEGSEVVCDATEGLRAAGIGILAHRAVTTGEEQAIDLSALAGE